MRRDRERLRAERTRVGNGCRRCGRKRKWGDEGTRRRGRQTITEGTEDEGMDNETRKRRDEGRKRLSEVWKEKEVGGWERRTENT